MISGYTVDFPYEATDEYISLWYAPKSLEHNLKDDDDDDKLKNPGPFTYP